MKQDNGLPPAGKTPKNHIAFQGGTYSLIISAVVLALMIVINILVSALPSTLTQYDISAAQLYSITSNTKVVVNALEKDVTIYWIVQSGEEDQIIENLLDKYESLSDHITVEKKNPDIYPTFAEQYTGETVQNNSLVVECGDKYRFIGYDDIYLYETDMYSYSYNASFDGEGAITSAIDYVVSEELPQVYVLEGHGEAELPSVFSEQVEKENLELTTFSLLTADEIPEEADRSHYAFQSPLALLPDMASSDITDPLVEENYYPILPVAQGLIVSDTASNVTSLLTTSDTAFSKIAGYEMESYEKEEGDIDGPFTLAVSISCSNDGQIIWFSSSFLEDMYNTYSSGANVNLGMNALSSLVGESEAMAIRSKSLNYNYLTISESTSSLLQVLMIGVFPLAYLGVGICVALRRRRLQHETI